MEQKNVHQFKKRNVVIRMPTHTFKHIAKAAQSQRYNQSFVKELASPCPRKEKQKISPRFAKIKSADTQTDKPNLTRTLLDREIRAINGAIQHRRKRKHCLQHCISDNAG